MKRESGRILVLWGASERVPKNEGNEENPYERDSADWDVEKINIPESPRDGARGKRVIYIQPGPHPYMDEYAANLKSCAASSGIELSILKSRWDDEIFDENVNRAIAESPDLILLNPENQQKSVSWYRRINQAGIPVVGGNFLPGREAFPYLLAWTGPDDWGQSRMLARALADKMNRRGNYAILQHLEGTSSYYARTYAVISELKKQAPAMHCLDCRSPGMGREDASQTVREWLNEFGDKLEAIVSADDDLSMLGVLDTLKEAGREDIVTVAMGSSQTGLELLQQGNMYALAYQSAAVDGTIAMQTIIDWFEGVPLEPVRYLPKYIIRREEAPDFLEAARSVHTINLEKLYRSVRECDWEGVFNFYGDLYELLLKILVVPQEMLQGLCLEILTGLMEVLKENGLAVTEILGSYESMIKHLLRDDDAGRLLEWMNDLSQNAVRQTMISQNRKTPIQQVLEYLDTHFGEPLSLKTLALEFGFSQVYLGQLFRRESGEKFNDYLNKKRIEKACLLLRGKNVKANAIALELGYSDPAYFYKLFKKFTGLSVSCYVKENS